MQHDEPSALPAANRRMIDIVTVNPTCYPATACATEFSFVQGDDVEEVVAVVYAIDCAVTGGVVPSRSWQVGEGGIRMMFYVSDAIAPAARLFDGVMYCMVITPPEGSVLRYPAELNVLIDQVVADGVCSYVVLFNEENKDAVITASVSKGGKDALC